MGTKLEDYGTAEYGEHGTQHVLGFHCPGCGHAHAYYVPRWTWNGSMEKPSFTPSLVNTTEYGDSREKRVCHLYVTDGKIQFLTDCWHDLKGKMVEMEDAK
jgi:hypothetical protein